MITDEIPRKKPLTLEEQVVKDKHGRRRFHGAFTGGFSAGFYNTVGSLEGWRPTSFKSSRTEKHISAGHRPEDYMDEEVNELIIKNHLYQILFLKHGHFK